MTEAGRAEERGLHIDESKPLIVRIVYMAQMAVKFRLC